MITEKLSKLPEEYQTIADIIEYKVDDVNAPLTIERICDKILGKCD